MMTGMGRIRRMADLFTPKEGDEQTGIYGGRGLVRGLAPFSGPPTGASLTFRFTTHPTNQFVLESPPEEASFTVEVENNVGDVTYQWEVSTNDGVTWGEVEGATSATYNIADPAFSQDGDLYRCKATDDEDTITSNSAMLRVAQFEFAISDQPEPQTVAVDETATFTVVVTYGFTPYTYQWQVDDGGGFSNISGATSDSYETPPVAEVDDGNEYRCRITDAKGTVLTSAAALLTVGAAFNPLDNASVVEIYNAYDTSKHSYVAARALATYDTANGEIITMETGAAHGFLVDDEVVQSQNGPAELNGTFTVLSVPSSTTYTIDITPDAISIPGSPQSITGTTDWEDKKVSNVLGMRGLYNFSEAAVANMPQWDDTAKEMLFNRARVYWFRIADAIRDAITGADQARSIVAVCRRGTYTSGNFDVSGKYGTGTVNSHALRWSSSTQIQFFGHSGTYYNVSYTNAANNNGSTKLLAFTGGASLRALYVNDPTTPVASNSNDGYGPSETNDIAIGQHFTSGFDGAINVMVFADAVLSTTYLENFKAWCEASPRGVTFG
jgi:hypothetical protein